MKSKFAKGLLIYTVIMMAVIFAGLFVFWQFISAYERSRADGVMDRYMETQLPEQLDAAAEECFYDNFGCESYGAVMPYLQEQLDGSRLNYRKDPRAYTPETPVYLLRAEKMEIGRVTLVPGEKTIFQFGFDTWEIGEVSVDLSGFLSPYTVSAPAKASVMANGLQLDRDAAVLGLPPALEPYERDLAEIPEMLTYTLTTFLPPDISVSGDYTVIREENAFSILPNCPEETESELTTFCENFIRAYIGYTSGAVEGPGQVQSYMVPGGSLYQRMTASMDGMSWIHDVTSTMSGLQIAGYEYYGSAAIVDAEYVLTSGRNATDNHMRVILTQTAAGWRVANIELL